MRTALILVIALIPFSKCWAMPTRLCHDSVAVVADALSTSKDPDARNIYEVAFGKHVFSRSEIADFQRQDRMSEVLAILAQEDGNGRLNYLLSNGLNPNLTVPGGAPVIVAAVECMNSPVVDALINGGANIYASDSQNIDAVAEAIIVDSRDIFERLLSAGYIVDCKTKQGQLVMRLAKRMHQDGYINDLLKRSRSCESAKAD